MKYLTWQLQSLWLNVKPCKEILTIMFILFSQGYANTLSRYRCINFWKLLCFITLYWKKRLIIRNITFKLRCTNKLESRLLSFFSKKLKKVAQNLKNLNLPYQGSFHCKTEQITTSKEKRFFTFWSNSKALTLFLRSKKSLFFSFVFWKNKHFFIFYFN